jgi:hypothetical protein
VHQAPQTGLMVFSSRNSNLGRLVWGARCSRIPGRDGRNWGSYRTVSRFQNRMLVLDAASRCLSLWIGLLDEGLKWTPSLWLLVFIVRRRRLMARPLSGLDEHVCPLRVGLVPARDG